MSAWEGLNPPYSTIVADPPWPYDATPKGKPGWRKARGKTAAFSAALPYTSMTTAQIAGLPVSDLATSEAWLFLWTTNRYLPDSFGIIERWGFVYRQTLVWAKPSFPVGGCVTPNAAEFLLVCRLGGPRLTAKWPGGSVISAPKGATAGSHSRKPAVFLDLVERVAPGPYVELFARAPRLGWDSWGYGYESERSA